MAEINRVTNQSVEYIKKLVEEQQVKRQEQKRAREKETHQTQEQDQVEISQQARQLAEAQDFYRKFLEEKAKEIEAQRAEKVKELKQRFKEKPNTPLRQIAEQIAQEFLGM